MAQWPYQMHPVAAKPMPVNIPEEWQKANEALQAVIKQPKSDDETPTSNDNQVSNNYSGYNWPYQAYTGYPGYSYGFYNYNYNYMMGTNPLYMNPMGTPPQVPSTNASNPTAMSSDSKAEGSESDTCAVNFSPCQPPPPPPSPPPPPPSTNSGNFFPKQAPGSGGIKFILPKKKNQNKKFQDQRISQNGGNNFQNYNSFEQDKEASMQQNILQQKSVSSMSKDKWPPSLKNYVSKCFEKCKNDIDKDQVEIILKGKLVRAYNDGTIFNKDWDNEPLPRIHSERLELEEKMSPVKTKSESPVSNSKNHFQHRNRSYRSRSRSLSRSRSRSRSRTPPRKVIRKRRHSSDSSNSSEDSRGSRKILNSSIIGPSDFRNNKNTKNKKKKKKENKLSFTADPEYATDERLQKRAARFETKSAEKKRPANLVFTISNPFVIDDSGDGIEWSSDAVIGTCQDLEKPYLRLTGAVDPSSVRPEDVLVKALSMVKKHWIANQDYHYACEQLKSIRQDLVVQCIRNKFTIQVYETHARTALEKGDHTEFNQCQSQLKILYQELGEGNRLEFTGYHILYNLYTENTLELKNILCELSAEDKKNEVVSHALQIAKACSNNNYHRFFKLYKNSPLMSSFVIDWFVERIRKAALKAIIKSFRPNLPVSHIQSALAFSSSEDCMGFLTKANLIFGDSGVINCKESMAPLANF